MAEAAAASPTPLLDLSFLTEEEREKIESVLRADQELQTRDRVRLGTLRQKVEQDRTHQKDSIEHKHCAVCEKPFGFFFNRGAPCPNCVYRVCKSCRWANPTPPPPFTCSICNKKRLLDLQSVDYMPQYFQSTEPPPLYGTELVSKSLMIHGRGTPASEAPEGGSRSSRSSQHSSSLSPTSSTSHKSASAASSAATASSSLGATSARRVSPQDLLSDSDEDASQEGGRAWRKPAPPLPIGSFQIVKRSEIGGSFGSMTSLYSESAGKGDYEISGRVLLGVWFKDDQLFVRVNKASGLAAAKKGVTSDPYIKMYLLPDRHKQSKRKTGIQRKTINPVYNETFRYKVARSDLLVHTLWLSVWDWDRFGRNRFLGEVRLPLTSLDLTDSEDKWHHLEDKDDSALDPVSLYRGRLKLSLRYEATDSPQLHPGRGSSGRGILRIKIQEAEDLPIMDANSLTDATVKCLLLPNRSLVSKRKTRVVKDSLSPVWNEEFTYKVSRDELRERVLEVTLWDYDRRGSNDFVGGLRLGGSPSPGGKRKEWMDSVRDEAAHWEAMLAHPGEWAEEWHTLRPSMDPMAPGAELPVPMPRDARAAELSPVEEASPTRELSTPEGGLLPQSPPSFLPPESSAAGEYPVLQHEEDRRGLVDETPPTSPPLTVPVITFTEASQKWEKEKEEVEREEEVEEEWEVTGKSVTRAKPQANFGSMLSIYGGTKGDYEILGEVLVGVQYKDGQLYVHVNRARGLAAVDSNGFSDPYVKTYLLPDRSKHSKRKTSIKKKTLDPVYNETLKYKVPENDLGSRTLFLSVWDHDRLGHNDFLGEVRLPLASIDLNDAAAQWHTLQDKDPDMEDKVSDKTQRGKVLVAVMFCPDEINKKGKTLGTLSVAVQAARQLPVMDKKGLSDGFVKLYLLPDTSSSSKHKTAIMKNNLNPVWEETFTYKHVVYEDLAVERVLEVTVWDHNRGASNDFIGGVRIGPLPGRIQNRRDFVDSVGDEAAHWEAMLAQPGVWVERWHALRLSMTPRFVDLSSIPPPAPLHVFTPEELGKPAPNFVSKLASLSPSLSPERDLPKIGRPASGRREGPTTSEEEPLFGAKVDVSLPKRREEPAGPTSVTSLGGSPQMESPAKEEPTTRKSPQVSGAATAAVSVQSTPGKKAEVVEASEEMELSAFARPRSCAMIMGQPLGQDTVANAQGTSPPFAVQPAVSTSLPPMEAKDRSAEPHPLPVTESRMNQKPPRQPAPAVESMPLREPAAQPSPSSHRAERREGSAGSRHLGLTGRASSLASFGSLASIYSESGAKGDYDITGEVLVGVQYKDGQLSVHVNRVQDLAAADSNGFSDPYIKTYLLPDRSKHSKRKTSIKKKTLDPVYNETLKYKVSSTDIVSRTLWLSVWDWDRFGRNQFLGEVRLPLSSLDLKSGADHWYTLQDKDESGPTAMDAFYRGELRLGLMFTPAESKGKKGTLTVMIRQAKELPAMDPNGLTDSAVKMYLLPNKSSSGKRKTHVIKNNLNPVWDEPFVFDVHEGELRQERVLEVTVWDYDRKGSDFIGGLRLGPIPPQGKKHKPWMDSIGDEVSHWEAVLVHPEEMVEQWHTLRPSMDPRKVDFSAADPLDRPSAAALPTPSVSSTPIRPVMSLQSTEDHSPPVFLDDEFQKVSRAPKTATTLSTPIVPIPSGRELGKGETKEEVEEEKDILPPRPKPPLPYAGTGTPPLSVRMQPAQAAVTNNSPSLKPKQPQVPLPTPPVSESRSTSSERELSPVELMPPTILVQEEMGGNGSPPEASGVPTQEAGSREDTSSPEDEQEASKYLQKKKAGVGSLLGMAAASSLGSMASVYSEAGGKGDYEITGEVLVGVQYKDGQLSVHVNRARDLAAADSNGFSDPYVKTYLLPDRSTHSKRKTSIKKKTLNPVYNETLKYKVTPTDIGNRTLWLSVWDWDRFGRNQFLGEVRLSLSLMNLKDGTDYWFSLQDKEVAVEPDTYHGQVKVGLMFTPDTKKKGKTVGTLSIVIKQARDLPRMDAKGGLTDSFVKCHLLPDRSSRGKRKTAVVKNNLTPVWEERFTYEKVVLEELTTERVLEISAWDFNKGSSNDFIGGLRIGPLPSRIGKHKEWMDSIGEEVSHWETMLACPGKWVEQWHTFRTTMDPRSVLLT